MSELNIEVLFQTLEQIAKQNFIAFSEIKEILSTAVYKAFHSKLDPDADLELILDEVNQEFKLINKSKLVVADDEFSKEYEAIEIPLSEAKKINPDIELDDKLAGEVDFNSYARVVAQQIKQMVTQNVKERKKEEVFSKHQSLKGEMIDVVVTSVSPQVVIFTLEDGTTAFMPQKYRNPNVELKVGQNVQVYVEDVLKESKDSQILVSNGSGVLVKRFLELEVPEISSGVIEIIKISRIPGERTKIAVKSNNENVDPVGSIIGANGSRIAAIVGHLQGEKIDIVSWSNDLGQFVANALSPAKVIGVINKKDARGNEMINYKIAITPNRHQTLAIGSKGMNVKLAAELTNTRIDVISLEYAQSNNVEFKWNGNVSPEEVQSIDSGQKITTQRTKQGRPNQRTPFVHPTFDTYDFEGSVQEFTSALSTQEENQEVPTSGAYIMEDDMFTEEELRNMEKEFELDDDEFGTSNEEQEYGVNSEDESEDYYNDGEE